MIPRWEAGEPLPLVILMDLKLPRVDGLEVLRQLRARPPHPVPARGGTHLPPTRIGTSRPPTSLHANSYIVKPVNLTNSWKWRPISKGTGVYSTIHRGKRMRLLHVEDDPTDIDLTRRPAGAPGPGHRYRGGAQPWAAARDCLVAPDHYEVALVDLKLPDGSGLELLTWIRDRQLPLAVVMLTGAGDPEAAITAPPGRGGRLPDQGSGDPGATPSDPARGLGAFQRRSGPAGAPPAGAVRRASPRRF
jgi:CheY-like chemotaxis protein